MKGNTRRTLDAFRETSNEIQAMDIQSRENFFLNLILPSVMVQSTINDADRLRKEEKFSVYFDRKFTGDHYQITAGSSSDGLSLPAIVHLNENSWFQELQDEDVLYVSSYLRISSNYRNAFARPEPVPGRPGYIRLHYNPEWSRRRNVRFKTLFNRYVKCFENLTEFLDKDGHVLRTKITGKLRKYMKGQVHSREKEIDLVNFQGGKTASVEFSYNGPAITADVFEQTGRVRRSKDYVIALPHPEWPEDGLSWRYRNRVWPSTAVVKSVIKIGCHVVPKCHKLSKDPLEFMISFALASRNVAASLSVSQIRCYILFKYIFKFYINKAKRGLSTFHCKQTMFWLCESCPQENWTVDNPYECLQYLFQKLDSFLEQHNLPNYFIEENNTIDHIGKMSIAAIRRDLGNIQKDTLSILLELTERKRFSWLSRDVSLVSIFRPSMSQSKLTKHMIICTIVKSICKFLDKGEMFLVFGLLGLNPNELVYMDTVIEKLEDILKSRIEKEDEVCIKGFLATVYHNKAQEMQEIAGDHRSYNIFTNKSRQLFEEILEDVHSHIWIFGEYYNLLSQQNSNDAIVRHFSQYLLHPSVISSACSMYEGGIYTAVNAHNRKTTDFCIQGTMGDFEIPSTAYLFYKVIQSLLKLHYESGEVVQHYHRSAAHALRHFETWTKHKTAKFHEASDDNIHVLLAFSYDLLGNVKCADKHFKSAEGFGFSYQNEPDDLVYFEPYITKLRKTATEWKQRLHKPYQRPKFSSKRTRKSANSEPTLKFKDVQINPFIHY